MAAPSYDLYGALPPAALITIKVDRNGIASCKVRAQQEASAEGTIQPTWALLSAAPRPNGLGLPCTGISLEWRREDGMWNCAWDYEGASDPSTITFGDPNTTTYEIDCSVTSAPIPTHTRFLDLMTKYGGSVNGKTYEWSGFPATLPGDTTGAKNPLFGAEDFYISTLTWRCSSSCHDLPADFRRNLGLIDTPRNTNGPALPTVTGRQNWLKTSARATWRGNIWSTVEEWSLSGIDGWNQDVYRPN